MFRIGRRRCGSRQNTLALTATRMLSPMEMSFPTDQPAESCRIENLRAKVASNCYRTVQTHMRSRLNSLNNDDVGVDNQHLEPIAIIGMAYKFPSGAETDTAFWDMLVSKHCASVDFPADRMNIDAFFRDDPEKPHSVPLIHTRKAHFLADDIRSFDAHHFGLSPSDAAAMDPNQRGLMETAYHAFENAGLSSTAYSGSKTSVHVGFFSSDHTTFNLRDPLRIPKYYATGSSNAILSNRISWHFNLKGASMTIDTACSSGSLAGTNDMALVGATNLILSPELNIALSNMNFLSRDGKCYSFDDWASGYARGEGFTVLILKPLSKALAAGDTIRALVRGTATNQDGHTKGGITQPSTEMQVQLIRDAYARYALDMRDTRFFEAHGTGTLIGDPIEAQAIGETFREFRTNNEPLYVGAVKSNIGHLEGASGLAGVVKAVLALEKGVIPPNTNFERLNPKIDSEFYRVRFPTQCIPWPQEGIRRASVNSFGFGGSNAHVILDDAFSYLRSQGRTGYNLTPVEQTNEIHVPANYPSPNGEVIPRVQNEPYILDNLALSPKLIILSSSDEAGISRQISVHEAYLNGIGALEIPVRLPSYSYTLGTHRTVLPWKSFGVINSLGEISSFASKMSAPIHSPTKAMNLGFIFTGQGAQWPGMGRELLREPIFRASIERSQATIQPFGCMWNTAERLSASDVNYFRDAESSQVLTTAVQLALVDLITWLGVHPSVVVGHSSGEIAAAFCANLISQETAMKISYYRGILASRLEATSKIRHSMVAVGLSCERAASEIEGLERDATSEVEPGSLSISCINSQSNVTVSGPRSQIMLLINHLASKQVFARELKVGLGYHSAQMTFIAEEYLSHLTCLTPGPSINTKKPVMISSVTGGVVDSRIVCNGEYWVHNMTSPSTSLGLSNRRLDSRPSLQSPVDGWLEIGPHATLRGPTREIIDSCSPDNSVVYSSALIRKKCALSSILSAAGQLLCHSFEVDMSHVVLLGLSPKEQHCLKVLHDLPKYQFSRSSLYWEEPAANKNFRFRKYGNHDLLGTMISELNPLESQWKFVIKEDDMPWTVDHKVDGKVLYPAAGMLVMAIEAAKQLLDDQVPIGYEMEHVEIPAPITLNSSPEGVEVRVHLSLNSKNARGDYKFRIFLYKADNNMEVVCSGTIRGIYNEMSSDFEDPHKLDEEKRTRTDEIDSINATCLKSVSSEVLYRHVREKATLDFGKEFKVLDRIRVHSSGKAVADVLPREPDSTSPHVVHPTRLDAIFQLGLAALDASIGAKPMIPTFISRLQLPASGLGHKSQPTLQAFACLQAVTSRTAIVDIKASDITDLNPRVEILGLEITALTSNTEARSTLANAPYTCLRMEWKADFDTMKDNEIQNYCDLSRPNTDEPVQYFRNMDSIVYQYGARALQKIDEQGGYVAPNMEKYANWLRAQIDALSSTPWMDGHEFEKLSSHRIPSRGSDPLQTIFADEEEVTAFYRELMEETTAIGPFNRYLDTIVHKRPDLKFLEVGAGTGSSTSAIMRVIEDPNIGTRFEKYIYTDISPSFFEQARSRFSKHTRMDFQVFNVEADPSSQGFELSGYDVVIADNVIHATQDLRTTLGNIRTLLRPGGKLILKELSTPRRLLTGFAFGLLPGWWLAKEPERTSSPLVTEEVWNELLCETGFSGVDLSFPDHFSDEAHIWTMMISTATDATPIVAPTNRQANTSPVFVLDAGSSMQQNFALRLARELDLPSDPSFLDLSEASRLCETEPNTHNFIFIAELGRSVLTNIEEPIFHDIQRLLGLSHSIVWVKSGATDDGYSDPEYGMSDGLRRVSRREIHNTLISVCITDTQAASITNVAKVYRLVMESPGKPADLEYEYHEMDRKLCVGRLIYARKLNEHVFKRTSRPVIHQQVSERCLEVGIRARGLLDTIEFSEDPTFNKPTGPDEVDVQVNAMGLNYKDCLTLLGKFDSDLFGSECAGIVQAVGADVYHVQVGDRVVVASHHVFRTYVRVPGRTVFRIPSTMSFVEAASLSTNFSTAYHSIINLARLQRGESILIHAAAGGTGQAMIQLARYIGAEIFATVGSQAKRDLLVKHYNIPRDHIFYSRDKSFAESLMKTTKGHGVDVIINSTQGRLLELSWNCIAICGRFVDIGLKDAYLRNHLPMHVFQRSASFASVNMNSVMLYNEQLTVDVMNGVLKLFRDGTLKPANPLHVYPLQDIEQALRFLQSGKSSGKVVLEVDKEAYVPIAQGPDSDFGFSSDATYVIAGGFGGIGRSMVQWLVRRGARHLIILSRSAGNERALEMLDQLRSIGVQIKCPPCDIADIGGLKMSLRECEETMPPIRGCIQAAMVLQDASFSDMSFADWQRATRPKVQGSWNLHEALPSGMDFFVLLSSCAGILGHVGQSNYCAGNTYQDAFARYRSSLGEKTVSVDVGVVLGEGFVAEDEELMHRLMRHKVFRPNTLADLFAILDYYCDHRQKHITAQESQVVTGFELPANILAQGSEMPSALEQPMFRCLHQVEGALRSKSLTKSTALTFRVQLASAQSLDAAGLIVSEALMTKLSRVLGLSLENFTLDSTLDSYGVDSLVGLELRNWLVKESGAELAVFEILGGVTIRDIGKAVASKSSCQQNSEGGR
ncbi:reducing type I polyketide synthase [Clohesyomyces aquaticus]|uniref:Reducing type I polyketide synthase n=1 Tax=Clohesyomyces aquaticus TaxID=1231657 RepID=A0A1Y1Y6H4_9PLEO|nr:reducing type I polyketide synthase [Clohesyomyces aquaticus]